MTRSAYFLLRPENSDCCPDYVPHCVGQHEEDDEDDEDDDEDEEDRLEYQMGTSPEAVRRPSRCEHGVMVVRSPQCIYHGLTIPLGNTVTDNCNNCTCQVRGTIRILHGFLYIIYLFRFYNYLFIILSHLFIYLLKS